MGRYNWISCLIIALLTDALQLILGQYCVFSSQIYANWGPLGVICAAEEPLLWQQLCGHTHLTPLDGEGVLFH